MARRVVGWEAEPVALGSIDVPLRGMHRGFLLLITVLVPVNLFIGWLKWLGYENDEQPLAFARYFDLGEEFNLPTWIASILLVTGAVSAAAAAQRNHDDAALRRGFLIIAAALTYVSLDEATYLHERASEPLRDWFGFDGALYWAWVLPAFVFIAVLAWLLWPFLHRLPADVRRDMLVSAGIYVSCAAGLEMLDALAYSVNESPGVVTELLTIVEECGEMLAALFFISTMVRYLGRTPAPSRIDDGDRGRA